MTGNGHPERPIATGELASELPEMPPRLVPQPHGGALLSGGKRGHKGGSGRTPEELYRHLERIFSRRDTYQLIDQLLHGDDKRLALETLKWAAERLYGKAKESLEHSGGVGAVIETVPRRILLPALDETPEERGSA